MEDIFRIPEQEAKSKFQEHGQRVYQTLLELRDKGDTRVRPHQTEAVLKTQSLINEFNIQRQPAPVLVVAPTGSGKTGIMVLLSYVLQCKKVLIVTPSADISNQIGVVFGAEKGKPCFFKRSGAIREEKTLNQLLEPVKIIQSATPIAKKERLPNLVIVNAQKFGGNSATSLVYGNKEIIANVREFFEQFDTLFVDEAHHYPAPTWTRIVEEFGVGLERKVVFLTATPHTASGVPILPKQQVAYQVAREDIEGKYIRPCDFKEVSEEEYSEDRLFDDINAIFIEQKKQEPRLKKHQALVLALKKDDCDDLVEMLNASLNDDNYAVAIYGDKKKDDKLKQFNDGKYTVAVVCGCLLEGYDNPNVSVCVIVRNVTSPLLFSQFTGRCLRMAGLGEEVDRTRACVLTYKRFKQEKLWRERDNLAETDPVVEGEEGSPGLGSKNGSYAESDGCTRKNQRRKSEKRGKEVSKRRKVDFQSGVSGRFPGSSSSRSEVARNHSPFIDRKYIRPCDFVEKQEYSEHRLFLDIHSILVKQKKQEPRIGKHQAVVLAWKRDECALLVAKLNAFFTDDYAVVIYTEKKKDDKLKQFNDGKYTVAVTTECLGCDNPNVSLCVILRNVTSPLLFSQFTGRCLRMAGFDGEGDRTRACVLSYKKFKQRRLWTLVCDEVDNVGWRKDSTSRIGGNDSNEVVNVMEMFVGVPTKRVAGGSGRFHLI